MLKIWLVGGGVGGNQESEEENTHKPEELLIKGSLRKRTRP